ncbi:hypothetical protein KGQ25_00880 [Patescibacteria group bacterium]|nr:hypothetical protein [Patescibacteria group bacterium]MDE2021609.1 hypothetical protein [Patescibacteria group bacterium]MDE2173166.1 hypothetical protein [Patescibacteria group bacterium]
MKRYAIGLGALVLAAAIALWVWDVRIAKAPTGTQGCTQEAKLCPDGSSVGRTGPNCEYAACPGSDTATGTGNSILPYDSGVQGIVSLGPTCPVERIPPDPSCADKPYATAIAVYHTGSQSVFLMGNSDASGAFKFSLPPGAYTLQATNGKTFPRCTAVTVSVPASGYASTTISCDTGIR